MQIEFWRRGKPFRIMGMVLGLLGLVALGLGCWGCGTAEPAGTSAGNSHRHGVAMAAEAGGSHPHPTFDPQAACACESARQRNEWCPKCNVGYIAGQRVEWGILFETLDPHGHDVNLSSITCEACRGAIDRDGYCDSCGMGFVKRQAYFTRLTHGLAKGRVVEAAGLGCAVCRSHAGKTGWCGGCGQGMVGNVAIGDRTTFDRTAQEFGVLQRAIEKAASCELCGCAMVVHRTCPDCGISYAGRSEEWSGVNVAPRAPTRQ
ncbi:MAG: hypothetical protein L0219_18785 [Phycisphaerales bacterium]|nr:hypothetical protein [Phycisphaerales bacterium]